jgi:hypothetical protein
MHHSIFHLQNIQRKLACNACWLWNFLSGDCKLHWRPICVPCLVLVLLLKQGFEKLELQHLSLSSMCTSRSDAAVFNCASVLKVTAWCFLQVTSSLHLQPGHGRSRGFRLTLFSESSCLPSDLVRQQMWPLLGLLCCTWSARGCAQQHVLFGR